MSINKGMEKMRCLIFWSLLFTGCVNRASLSPGEELLDAETEGSSICCQSVQGYSSDLSVRYGNLAVTESGEVYFLVYPDGSPCRLPEGKQQVWEDRERKGERGNEEKKIYYRQVGEREFYRRRKGDGSLEPEAVFQSRIYESLSGYDLVKENGFRSGTVHGAGVVMMRSYLVFEKREASVYVVSSIEEVLEEETR